MSIGFEVTFLLSYLSFLMPIYLVSIVEVLIGTLIYAYL